MHPDAPFAPAPTSPSPFPSFLATRDGLWHETFTLLILSHVLLIRACHFHLHCFHRLGHAYDPNLALWNFSPHGPFQSAGELASSSLLQPLSDGLRFTVVSETDARRLAARVCTIEAERTCDI